MLPKQNFPLMWSLMVPLKTLPDVHSTDEPLSLFNTSLLIQSGLTRLAPRAQHTGSWRNIVSQMCRGRFTATVIFMPRQDCNGRLDEDFFTGGHVLNFPEHACWSNGGWKDTNPEQNHWRLLHSCVQPNPELDFVHLFNAVPHYLIDCNPRCLSTICIAIILSLCVKREEKKQCGISLLGQIMLRPFIWNIRSTDADTKLKYESLKQGFCIFPEFDFPPVFLHKITWRERGPWVFVLLS